MPHPHQPSTPGPGPLDLLEVGAWSDLDDLAAALDLLEHHVGTITRFARAEVCDPDGFEPSPVCVLRPLVPVLHRVEEAFADLGDLLGSRVEHLRTGVLVATGRLVDADLGAAALLPTPARMADTCAATRPAMPVTGAR